MRAAALAVAVFVLGATLEPPTVRADTPDAAPPSAAAPAPPPAAAPPPVLPPPSSASDPAFYDTDASLPAHADDVADYTLVARLDAATHTIHGTGTIRWRNASKAAVHEVWVHLYLNAFKNEG